MGWVGWVGVRGVVLMRVGVGAIKVGVGVGVGIIEVGVEVGVSRVLMCFSPA